MLFVVAASGDHTPEGFWLVHGDVIPHKRFGYFVFVAQVVNELNEAV